MVQNYQRGLYSVSRESEWLDHEATSRQTALNLLINGDTGVSSPAEAHVRSLLPGADVNDGGDLDGSLQDTLWRQATGSSTSAGDVVEAYQLDSNDLMDDKSAVIYGVRDNSGGDVTDILSQVRFTTNTGGTVAIWDLNQLDVAEESDYSALAVNPLTLTPNKSINVELVAQGDLSTTTAELEFHGVVAEAEGEELEASTRFLSDHE